jgi:hypothetical protein
MNEFKLYEQLITAEDEDEVENILKKAALLSDDPDLWVPFSGNEMNYNVIGNQQADATAALVEKVINAIDAMLMAQSYKRGIDPQGPSAPRSMTHAIETFFNIQNGKIANLTAREQTALAENIHLVAVGSKPDPSYLVIDRGEGQTPQSFPDTFLSLKNSNKERIPFVQGKFSSGGTGILPFCGKRNYELIVSKRHPDCPTAQGDKSKGSWGFTVVRRMFPDENRRISMYVYLAPKGRILSFEANEIEVLPSRSSAGTPAKPYAVGLPYGTCIKLYSYRWKAKAVATTEARYELERFLHSPCLPFRITETRDYRAHYYSTTLSGIWTTVSQDNGSENKKVEKGFPSDGMLSLPDIGPLAYEIALFREEVDPRHFPHGIYFTLNGQVHGSLPSNFISSSLKFDYLSNYLLVSVECSKMNKKVLEDFFMASRDRMRRDEIYYAIQEGIREELKNHAGLREHNALRRQRDIEQALSDDKETVNLFQDLLNTDPALAALLGGGSRLVTTAGPIQITPFEGKKFPSFFHLKKEPKSGLVKNCPLNRAVRVEFETDADNNYFTRADSPGRIEYQPPNLCLSSHLWNGEFNTRFQMPWDAKVGDEIEVVVTVSDVQQEMRGRQFESRFRLKGTGEVDEVPHPGGRPNPTKSAKQANGKKREPALELPRVIEVRKEDWQKPMLKFDEFSAVKIAHADEEGYIFYLNMDNTYLLTELVRARDEDKLLIKFWYKYGLTLCAMGILREEKRKRSATSHEVTKNGHPEQEESSEDLDRVSQYAAGIACVIIPIIRRLYRGPTIAST